MKKKIDQNDRSLIGRPLNLNGPKKMNNQITKDCWKENEARDH